MRLSARMSAEWQALRAECVGPGSDFHLSRGGLMEVHRLGEGEPIVVLPGLAGGWGMVLPLARELARRHQVVLVGWPGEHAKGVASASARALGDVAEDVSEFLDRLRLERPMVFGLSYGGAVALELAVRRPGRIGALTTFGVEAAFRTTLGSTIARRVLERFPLPHDSAFINQFFNILHGGVPESPAIASFVADRIWETDQGLIAGRLRSLEGFDVSDRLWRIDVPTLVVAGTRDVVVPEARQRELARSISGARFETLSGAGHVGFVTHGAELARKVGSMMRVLQHSASR